METTQVKELYRRLIDSWNQRNAQLFAEQFDAHCLCIGFDGSEMHNKSEIADQLSQIFKSHTTAPYITLIREVRALDNTTAILHAHAGMTPNGNKVEPGRNAVQVMVASFQHGSGKVLLFQNTPAAYHGRPEAVAALTAELQQAADRL